MHLKLQGVKTEKVQVAPTSPVALNLQQVQFSQEHKQRQSIASREISRRARSRIMPSRDSESDRDSQQSSARDSIMPTLASMLKSVRSQRLSTRLSARLPSSRRASVPDGAWSADGNAEGGRQLQRSSQAASDGHGNRESGDVEEAAGGGDTAEDADARVARLIAEQRAQVDAAREAEEEVRQNDRLRPRSVNINTIGFAALKQTLMERGMPAQQLAACINKHALRAAAQAWPDALNITWEEEGHEGDETPHALV